MSNILIKKGNIPSRIKIIICNMLILGTFASCAFIPLIKMNLFGENYNLTIFNLMWEHKVKEVYIPFILVTIGLFTSGINVSFLRETNKKNLIIASSIVAVSFILYMIGAVKLTQYINEAAKEIDLNKLPITLLWVLGLIYFLVEVVTFALLWRNNSKKEKGAN